MEVLSVHGYVNLALYMIDQIQLAGFRYIYPATKKIVCTGRAERHKEAYRWFDSLALPVGNLSDQLIMFTSPAIRWCTCATDHWPIREIDQG